MIQCVATPSDILWLRNRTEIIGSNCVSWGDRGVDGGTSRPKRQNGSHVRLGRCEGRGAPLTGSATAAYGRRRRPPRPLTDATVISSGIYDRRRTPSECMQHPVLAVAPNTPNCDAPRPPRPPKNSPLTTSGHATSRSRLDILAQHLFVIIYSGKRLQEMSRDHHICIFTTYLPKDNHVRWRQIWIYSTSSTTTLLVNGHVPQFPRSIFINVSRS